MKTIAYLLLCIVSITQSLAQSPKKFVSKTYPLIEERLISLNGGIRAANGGKSRTFIKIDLPEHTREWYYSFTTKPGASGTANLNLALQLSSLMTGGIMTHALNTSGIKVPEGSASIDVSLYQPQHINSFLNKVDNNGVYIPSVAEASVQNTRQALVKVDDVKSGTWYLGIKNPSEFNGINIFIEVVAIVDELVPPSAEETRAIFYGNMGWKAYERGDYDKCLELSEQAVKIYPDLAYIWANMGLVQLIKGEFPKAIESYSKAMEIFKTCDQGNHYRLESIKDIEQMIRKHGDVEGAKDILETLKGV